MARFRKLKTQLREELLATDWKTALDRMETIPPRELVGPLMASLPCEEPLRSRAAEGLGCAVARLASESMEEARNVVRRLMWHMNEESGNIGWGIPEAFAAVLCRHSGLADTFAPILISYITQTGKQDNYCDHAILRRSCFAAVGLLLESRPDFAALARPALQSGLHDPDEPCRELAGALLRKVGLFESLK